MAEPAQDAPGAFYIPDGRHYAATVLTRGPWNADSQHAGPPCALLGRAMDRAGALVPARLTRATFEILGPVPIARLTPTAEVIRPGRSVELIEGTLEHEGRAVMRARAWRIRLDAITTGEAGPEPDPVAGPGAAQHRPFFATGHEAGYQTAMETRFVHGGFTEPGPALAWMRMRVPLVAGEEPTQLDRVLVAADSGNGVSAPLDYRQWMFINTDVSVFLRRLPQGKWVALQATTYVEDDGVGLSDTMLHDERGMIGRANQSLLVAPR